MRAPHRLGTYSAKAATIPPAAVVAARALAADPRAEPRYLVCHALTKAHLFHA